MDLSERAPSGDFIRQVGTRLCAHGLAKFIGVAVGTTVFFLIYFQLLHHPFFRVRIMPLTAVDRFFAFRPEALLLYVSLWIYIPLAFALLKNRRELLAHGAAAVAMGGIGLGLFLLWPTAVPDLGDNWARYPAFAFLKTVDASGNACPSLHVAFAVFTAIRLARLWPEMQAPAVVRTGSWLWCLGIIYSTLATDQHVALDALAGSLLGAVMGVPWFARLSPATPLV